MKNFLITKSIDGKPESFVIGANSFLDALHYGFSDTQNPIQFVAAGDIDGLRRDGMFYDNGNIAHPHFQHLTTP